MKFNLNLIAAAVALAAAGSAHANIVGGANSSLVVAAFNTETKAAYYRDTGFLLNTFLPSSVTTAAGDGGVTGDKTPELGLTLNKSNTPSFADVAFSDWLAGQDVSKIRWTAFAADNSSAAGTNNVSRLLLAASKAPSPAVNNGAVTNAQAVFTGLTSLSLTLSTTRPTVLNVIEGNLIGQAATLGTLDSASDLYYYARSQGTLANSTLANTTLFQNSLNVAKLTLATNGDLTYSLASAVPAVPEPGAFWMLGAGLLAIGGVVRRRQSDSQA